MKYRTLIEKIDMVGMTHEQVAGMLDLPLGTVKTRHKEARARLRSLLAARLDEGAGGDG